MDEYKAQGERHGVQLWRPSRAAAAISCAGAALKTSFGPDARAVRIVIGGTWPNESGQRGASAEQQRSGADLVHALPPNATALGGWSPLRDGRLWPRRSRFSRIGRWPRDHGLEELSSLRKHRIESFDGGFCSLNTGSLLTRCQDANQVSHGAMRLPVLEASSGALEKVVPKHRRRMPCVL